MKKEVFNKVLQIGFVVNDCEKTAMVYAEKYGIGPWAIYGPECMKGIEQYGKPCAMKIKVASAFLGDMELELIEPLDNLSLYADFLQKQGQGLHHLAFGIDDFAQTMDFCRQEQVPVILSGEFGQGERFAYIDAWGDLRCIIELYDSQPGSSYPNSQKIIDVE